MSFMGTYARTPRRRTLELALEICGVNPSLHDFPDQLDGVSTHDSQDSRWTRHSNTFKHRSPSGKCILGRLCLSCTEFRACGRPDDLYLPRGDCVSLSSLEGCVLHGNTREHPLWVTVGA